MYEENQNQHVTYHMTRTFLFKILINMTQGTYRSHNLLPTSAKLLAQIDLVQLATPSLRRFLLGWHYL